jgi:hypothetical protein
MYHITGYENRVFLHRIKTALKRTMKHFGGICFAFLCNRRCTNPYLYHAIQKKGQLSTVGSCDYTCSMRAVIAGPLRDTLVNPPALSGPGFATRVLPILSMPAASCM